MTLDPNTLLGTVVGGEFKPPSNSNDAVRAIELRVVRYVGAGKFAWVFEAHDQRGARFAVKYLYRDDNQAMRRFQREIKVMRQLPPHPNRVSYAGHGMHGKNPWVAMEFVDGFTLGAIVRQKRPVPDHAACALMVQLCDGFNGLHKLGLTHRDITPDNIMIMHMDRSVKLMDFGLVQDSQGLLQLYEQADILQGNDFLDDLDAGLIAGTPEFMAPEQISDPHEKDRSKYKTDTMADVFALGTIFYQLLSGQQLFPWTTGSRGRTGKEGLIAYLDWRVSFRDDMLVCPSNIRPELWSIVRKSLSHDPKMRQRDGSELAADVRFYLETGQGVLEDDMSATIAQQVDLAKLRSMAAPMSTRDFSALKGSLHTGEPAYAAASTVREMAPLALSNPSSATAQASPTVQDRTTEAGGRAAPSRAIIREAVKENQHQRVHSVRRSSQARLIWFGLAALLVGALIAVLIMS